MRAHSLEMKQGAAGQFWEKLIAQLKCICTNAAVWAPQEELEAVVQQQSSDVVAVMEL